jgi:hypothetical protein
MTSPVALVSAIAAAKDRHGAVTEHGLTSLPYEATNVRGAANAGPTANASKDRAVSAPRRSPEIMAEFLEGMFIAMISR